MEELMETNTNPKMTNYERKLQARREAEAKEKKENIAGCRNNF